MDMKLRPVTPDDEPFLYELYQSAHSAELPLDHLDPNQRELIFRTQYSAQKQTYSVQFPKAEDKIILLDGRRVGRLLVERREDEIRGVDIGLLPEYRSTGVGTLIIKDLMAEAEMTGKPFRIQVVKTNRAARLYERLGIYKTGESGLHFSMEWTPGK
jgi:GNAT superfamily N-acetyltransferase